MKRTLPLFIIFVVACTASQRPIETDNQASVSQPAHDTTATDTATTYELSKEEHAIMRAEGSLAFTLAETARNGTILNKDISTVIAKAYSPDFLLTDANSNEEVAYNILSTEVIETDLVTKKGKCAIGAALLCLKSKNGEEEYHLFFLGKEDGEVVVRDKATFPGSYAQTSASATISTEYLLSDHCGALAVESESEGGDIDLSREKYVTFFIVDDNGDFYEVLNMVTEQTHVQEMEVTGDENKNSTSDVRTFEIAETKTNFLNDIKAHLISKSDGAVTHEEDELYQFDGKQYVKQIN
jgi:hypothetical protein